MAQKSSSKARLTGSLAAVGIAAAALCVRCTHPNAPAPGSPSYKQTVSDFYGGLLAMNVGDDKTAAVKLAAATQDAPEEPAAWANLGLYQLRHSNLADAAKYLTKAHEMAPSNSRIETMLGYLATANGQYAEAIQHFQKASQLDPRDLVAQYALIQSIQQQGGPTADTDALKGMKAILAVQPDNLFVQIEAARLAARNNDTAFLSDVVSKITPTSSWSAESRDQLSAVTKDIKAGNWRQVSTDLAFLSNLLRPTPEYTQAQSAIVLPQGIVGVPVEQFLVLKRPSPLPAPADTGMTFTPQPVASGALAKPSVVQSVFLSQDGPVSTITADGKGIEVTTASASAMLPFSSSQPGPNSVVTADWSGDSRADLLLASAAGVRLIKQAGSVGAPAFTDVTVKSGLPAAVTGAAYTGAWAFDIDSDGDLDVILGSKQGIPTVLRNNGDGTFTVIHPFTGPSYGLTSFVWADVDGDGYPDAAFLDSHGALRVYHNLLAAGFKETTLPTGIPAGVALAAADTERSGHMGLSVWTTTGAIVAVTSNAGAWKSEPVATGSAPPVDGSANLIWADLDNNGAPDLIATGSSASQAWLADPQDKLQPLAAILAATRLTVDEQNDQGRVDLVGVAPDGSAVRLANKGTKPYGWQEIRLEAAQLADKRNNAFGIGGTIELRAGLLYASQTVTHTVTHFGLGEETKADAVRITWPNGVTQGEFDLPPTTIAKAPERLKGSCPWLFAWNGHDMGFVTDFLWRSAIGLRINGQNTAGVVMTSDWNKIRNDQLVARDGFYDLSLTTQLWETYYFDEIKLMTVDHPANTDIWVDERFSIPPPKLAYRVMTKPRPIAKAVDDNGADVSSTVAAIDGNYLDTFGRGEYQGITRDHWVEVDLGKDLGTGGALYLLCNGWIHPTDSSINLALSQGKHPAPTSLRVQVPDGHGGWRTAAQNIGFPEGKFKTMLIPLAGLFKPGMAHKVRLATNLEVYWDWMAVANDVAGATTKARTFDMATGDLGYHGFNVISKPNLSSPDVPIYDQVGQTTQRWMDMTGYYTRYGDVRPLLTGIDDRYIIMNAGDELKMRFAAPAPPAAGWTRDFVLIGDGWGKDCDHSGGFSTTVLPLPYHADRFYTRAPGRLEDEPVYKMHPQDWVTYQTRYVTPVPFRNAFKPNLTGE